jgi:hypothetical protein
MSFGTQKSYQRKPFNGNNSGGNNQGGFKKDSGFKKEGNAPALDFPKPDPVQFPAINLQIKEGENYNYVTTIYPNFTKDSKGVYYKTSKKFEGAPIYLDQALVVKEQQEDGSYKIVGIMSKMTNKAGFEQYVPVELSPTPFFGTNAKPATEESK